MNFHPSSPFYKLMIQNSALMGQNVGKAPLKASLFLPRPLNALISSFEAMILMRRLFIMI